MLTDNLIEQILTTLPHKTVGLLGDLFLDRYLDIDAVLTEPRSRPGSTPIRSWPCVPIRGRRGR